MAGGLAGGLTGVFLIGRIGFVGGGGLLLLTELGVGVPFPSSVCGDFGFGFGDEDEDGVEGLDAPSMTVGFFLGGEIRKAGLILEMLLPRWTLSS